MKFESILRHIGAKKGLQIAFNYQFVGMVAETPVEKNELFVKVQKLLEQQCQN